MIHDSEAREWLVTDQQGSYAMGTSSGIRTRKYHGYFMGIAGRAQAAFLSDIEMDLDGRRLWPHRYMDAVDPEISASYVDGPCWNWKTSEGELLFRIESLTQGSIRLVWEWKSRRKDPVRLRVRPLFGFRDLHSLGGQTWAWERLEDHIARLTGGRGEQLFCQIEGSLRWEDDALWYYRFHYAEEARRGYESTENLFSAGILSTELRGKESCAMSLALDPSALAPGDRPRGFRRGAKLADFVLTSPAGVVAGYPWFGEWGRDTFIALPGIMASLIDSGEDPAQVASWGSEVLERWGRWIDERGMLPNVLEREGAPQWDSADATLWYCHSVAALWQQSLCGEKWADLGEIARRFLPRVFAAVTSIENGRHRHLELREDGLLGVISPHATWMDARLNGLAITPRVGALPEINALWFQVRCLLSVAGGLQEPGALPSDLVELGRRALRLKESDRPHSVFMHSLPLAPSFVLRERASLEADLRELSELFWTPVGLRSLSPLNPAYRRDCCGTQEERDRAYHQGPVWDWLGGHYQMAWQRLAEGEGPASHRAALPKPIDIQSEGARELQPIEGHVAEIHDAEEPFVPRGAPAQAWSLACFEEARIRLKSKADIRLGKWLAGQKKRQSGRSATTGLRSARRPDQELT